MRNVECRAGSALLVVASIGVLVLFADRAPARVMTTALDLPVCSRTSVAECATNPVPCAQAVRIDTARSAPVSASSAESPLVQCARDTAGAARPSGCASLRTQVGAPRSSSVVDDAKAAECGAEGQVEDQDAVSRETHDFGTRTLGGTEEYFGSEVSVRVPYDGLFHEDDEFVLNRVVVQSSFTADRQPGLVQAGIYRSGPNAYLDTCTGASNRNYYRYYEWKLHYYANDIANYHCRVFTELGALTPGSDADTTFGVHYTGPSGGDPAYNWRIDVRSDTHVTLPLNFHTGFPGIGAEIFDNRANDDGGAADFASRTATVYGTTRHWRIDQSVNDSSPRQVAATDPTRLYESHDPGRWSVPNPPTPITIAHN